MRPASLGGAREPGAATEALRQLLRAAHTLRTYPANNAMSWRALEVLRPALEAAVPLELTLAPDRVLHGETSLLEPDEERTGLFARLYGDGIRRIRLEEGLEPEEVERLVAALAKPLDPDDLREDYVVRLWEAELPHVRVAAVDPYLDTEFAEDVLEGKQRPSAEQEDVGRVPEPGAPPPPQEAFTVGEEEARSVARAIEASRAAAPWESFVRALTETFGLEPGIRRREECVHLLEATFQRLVEPPGPRLELARSILRWLRSGSAAAARDLLRPAVIRLSDPERLSPLHAALEQGEVEGEAVAALLADLGPRGAEVALVLLGRSSSASARRAYEDAVVSVGAPAVPVLLAALGREDAAQEAVLARALGRIRAPESAAPLARRIQAEAPVLLRRELVRALAAIGGAEAAATLADVALRDADGACRVLALRGLGRSRTRIGFEALLERVRGRAFRTLGEEEKDLLFQALGAAAGGPELPALARMLRPRLLGGAAKADRRRAAAAIAAVADPGARLLLERGAHGRLRRGHAALCAEALRRREEDGR